ncbi:hypothetical protein D3C78_1631540 [compost metagenome]
MAASMASAVAAAMLHLAITAMSHPLRVTHLHTSHRAREYRSRPDSRKGRAEKSWDILPKP